ncbi:MAG TPA: hypothetical protein VIM87_28260 [Chitinophaga sp.]
MLAIKGKKGGGSPILSGADKPGMGSLQQPEITLTPNFLPAK